MIQDQTPEEHLPPMPYRLHLTHEDWQTISFVGHRYAWSAVLISYQGMLEHNALTESAAWDIAEAIEEDMKGDHSPFPMLDPQSDLYRKLVEFWDSIV